MPGCVEINEKINVGIGSLIAASGGAEDSDVADSTIPSRNVDRI